MVVRKCCLTKIKSRSIAVAAACAATASVDADYVVNATQPGTSCGWYAWQQTLRMHAAAIAIAAAAAAAAASKMHR